MALTDEDKQWITDQLDTSMGRLGARLMNCMLEFRGEVTGRLQALETQMQVLASSQQSVDAKFSALTKATLDSSSAISSLYGLQMERSGALRLMKPAA